MKEVLHLISSNFINFIDEMSLRDVFTLRLLVTGDQLTSPRG